MDDSEKFQNIVVHLFPQEKLWKSGYDIKDEETGKVVVTDGGKFFVSSCSLNKVQNDLDEVDDIDGKLNFLQGLVIIFGSIIVNADQVNTLKGHDIW